MPAKFYEYPQTGKPIFAVAERGALTDLLQSTGSGIWADPGDPADIASKFLLALVLTARQPEEVEWRWAGQYHSRSLTLQLTSFIFHLTEGAGTANVES